MICALWFSWRIGLFRSAFAAAAAAATTNDHHYHHNGTEQQRHYIRFLSFPHRGSLAAAPRHGLLEPRELGRSCTIQRCTIRRCTMLATVPPASGYVAFRECFWMDLC
uniref:Putative secreted protein n=1 Tax=Anopheles darlingi TaxID=43151 RepID=A0A2M4DJC2_ANODA